MLIGPSYFFLEVDKSEEQLEDGDPTHYLYETTGSVFSLDNRDRRSTAGRFKLYYVDVGAAVNARASIYNIFDSHANTFDYFGAIFDPDTVGFSERLSKLFKDDEGWGNILIIDRLEILPKYRSLNLGLIVMRRLIERFGGGTAFVAIKPFPLQCEAVGRQPDKWRDKLKLSDFDRQSRSATAKLRRHYAKLGFKSMKGTPFMFRLTSYALPKPADLLRMGT
ncbi:hypothetical protein INH39_32990 [Massilia violaceinigra]|uniref:N-acetyltransferase domain-containing protein n=1 Tax=Massilia violaceinigra TaxID=2045208 RepID=A0ABY4A5T7_9BURK|nr:hypothetical protein [Massilia violaceinigra]UOD30106.1 hypothetical protein INH39_32990 [Massilia violaceinigra]